MYDTGSILGRRKSCGSRLETRETVGSRDQPGRNEVKERGRWRNGAVERRKKTHRSELPHRFPCEFSVSWLWQLAFP